MPFFRGLSRVRAYFRSSVTMEWQEAGMELTPWFAAAAALMWVIGVFRTWNSCRLPLLRGSFEIVKVSNDWDGEDDFRASWNDVKECPTGYKFYRVVLRGELGKIEFPISEKAYALFEKRVGQRLDLSYTTDRITKRMAIADDLEAIACLERRDD